MLAFIYRDGSFIAENATPNITTLGGVMVHPGDTVILIAQNEGEVYDFILPRSSEETASLTRGWNLIAMTENHFLLIRQNTNRRIAQTYSAMPARFGLTDENVKFEKIETITIYFSRNATDAYTAWVFKRYAKASCRCDSTSSRYYPPPAGTTPPPAGDNTASFTNNSSSAGGSASTMSFVTSSERAQMPEIMAASAEPTCANA